MRGQLRTICLDTSVSIFGISYKMEVGSCKNTFEEKTVYAPIEFISQSLLQRYLIRTPISDRTETGLSPYKFCDGIGIFIGPLRMNHINIIPSFTDFLA